MNEFVEECRREWKRLGVPEVVATEMAADLAADLDEAEAEGASAEAVLGRGAFDPRSFAAAWAAERGLIRRPQMSSGRGFLRSRRLPAAIGCMLALVAIIGAVLVIPTSSTAPRPFALPLPPDLAASSGATSGLAWIDAPARRTPVTVSRMPVTVIAVDRNDSGGVDTHTVGSVLLIVGLAGSVLSMLFWLWGGPGGWSTRGTYDDPSPPAY